MTHLHRPGFVRAEGTRIVDDAGPLLLRGVGLGTWLLPEGYMWRFGDDLASPRQIEARIARLLGAAGADDFWRRFHDAFIADDDFALIAAQGFDHVRLPMNARALIDDDGSFHEDGFALVEHAVALSERHGLRVLLDLHGAPGGQTGTNIDDSPNGKPELFMSEHYRSLTIRLWVELARRYRDRDAVLGYDLLNEPLPEEWQHRYRDELVALYRDLTAAIRAVDDRHLLMYEGSHWATNADPVSERFDGNQAVQFHRYWCAPDEGSIEEFLALREAIGTPLYMGEGGENTPGWVYAATRLYERHDIGWNFWPWKKLGTRTSPLSADVPEGWDLIGDPEVEIPAERAREILDGFLEAIRCSACTQRSEVVDALFARPGMTLPAWAGLRGGAAEPIAQLVDGPLAEGIWHHTNGAPYAAHERPAVVLLPSERLEFVLVDEPSDVRVMSEAGVTTSAWEDGVLTLSTVHGARIVEVEVRA